jgi:hypothetical protein
LWGMQFGNGIANQATNTLFFTAGPGAEDHGLFGRITAQVPEPTGIALALFASGCLALRRVARVA